MEKMDLSTFKERIKSFEVVYSIEEGIPYTIISVNDKFVKIVRGTTGSIVRIKMEELYNYYINENYYDTKIAKDKKYISGHVQSPAAAILCALTEE